MVYNQEQPLVSIQCLVYNHEPYLRQCLDGFVMQVTNFKFEAIVHDDVSTDGSVAIIREYAQKYPDIIKPILETENQYSKGDGTLDRIVNEACRGKYIAICEGDDYWIDPLKLQKQVDFMEDNNDCSLCFHNAEIFYEKDNRFAGKHRIYSESRYANQLDIFCDGGFIPTLSIMYRTKYFENFTEYPDSCPVGDLKIQTYATLVGKVYYINETMGVYRRQPSSATHVFSATIDSYVNHHNRFIQWYKDVDKYTNGKIHSVIQTAISFSEGRIAVAKKDYFKLWNPRYRTFISRHSKNTKIGLYLSMIGCAWIYKLGHNILSVVRKIK